MHVGYYTMEISHWFLVISKSLKIRSKYVGADPEGVIYIWVACTVGIFHNFNPKSEWFRGNRTHL